MTDKKETRKNICEKCLKECKQPKDATLVSCPDFKEPKKNLGLFDSRGNVSARLTKKKAGPK